MEAGGNDDGVDLTHAAIGGDDGVRPHRGDAIGDDIDVRLCQCRVVGVRHQDALAADLPARGDFGAQPGIGDRALDVALGKFLHRHKHFGCIGQGETDELLAAVDGASYQPLVAGNVREGKAFCGRVVAVETGKHPRGGALIHVKLLHSFGQFGDDLDGRGSGADDGDAFAGQVDVVIPPGGVEDLALELVETIDVRQCRLGQRTHCRHHEIRREGPRRSAHMPPRLLRVPPDLVNLAAEPVSVEHPMLSRDPLDVRLDLGLFGIRTGPPSVRRERVGIQVRRHIAGRPRVGVHPPGAADIVSPLDHQKVGVPVLLKGDRGAEPGESGADDQHADMVGCIRVHLAAVSVFADSGVAETPAAVDFSM